MSLRLSRRDFALSTLGLAAASAFAVGEYEGEGAMRVPTWPVRFLLVGTCLFSALCYLVVMILDWAGVPPERIASMEGHQSGDKA